MILITIKLLLAISILFSLIQTGNSQVVRQPTRFQPIQQQDRNNQRFQVNPQAIRGVRPGLQSTKKETKSIEAESLRANASGGSVATQNMRQFGKWSGDNQLIWTGNRPSQLLRLPFNAPATAEYNLTVYMTKANYFGDVAIGMNGRQLATFSGFSTRVERTAVNLGKVQLRQGSNELIFSVTGKFTRSGGYRVGVDRVVITRDVPVQRPPVQRPPVHRPPVNQPPVNQPQGNPQGQPGRNPNRFPNQPPSTNNPSTNRPTPPNRPWSDRPIESIPGPPKVVTFLPSGTKLTHLAPGKGWNTEPRQLEEWNGVAFQWNSSNLKNSTAALWQVTIKPPPQVVLKLNSDPLQTLFIPGHVTVGISDSENSSKQTGGFYVRFEDFRHLIKDPLAESFYVRAIPINNSVDRKIVGQPSNVIVVKPPIQFHEETFQSNDNYDGNVMFLSTVGETGTFDVINRQELARDWSVVVPGNFGGMKYTDLFAYDRTHGKASFFRTDGRGKLRLLREMNDWLKTWDIVVPGKFNNDAITDLFVYSRRTREAKILLVNENGSFTTKKHLTNLNIWDEIVSGQFGGNSLSDLLFYSRIRGQAKIFAMENTGEIRLLKSHQWSKTWDEIVPCNVDDTGHHDLLLYRKVTGDIRLVATNNGATTIVRNFKSEPSWDLIVPGFYNSDSKTDFFFYDRVNQRGQYAMGQLNNIWMRNPIDGMSSYNSHIISGGFDNQPGSDLMFYDNHYEIRLHAIRCLDSDGGRATEINPQEVQQWVEFTNKVFTQAGIKFLFEPESDFEELPHMTINSLDPSINTVVYGLRPEEFGDYLYGKYGIREEYLDPDFQVPDGWTTNQAERLMKVIKENQEAFQDELQRLNDAVETKINIRNGFANEYAASKSGKMVVYFRWGNRTEATGVGYSGNDHNMVVMPGFKLGTMKLLSHEIGHYLGLGHTFGGYGDVPENAALEDQHLAEYLKTNGLNIGTLDGDSWSVLDTPPDVHSQYYVNRGLDPFDLSNEVILNKTTHGIDARFSPDPHNVMSYFRPGNRFVRISTDQVNHMRAALHSDRRGHLIGKTTPVITDAIVIPDQ